MEANYPLHPPKNKGREAMVYLSYIIDHYDNLPDVSLFVHASEGWHDDLTKGGMVELLPRIRIAHLLNNGYTNLRCSHVSGCHPKSRRIRPKATEDEIMSAELFNKDYRLRFADSYMQVMNIDDINQVPEEIGNICCAQFAVPRSTILKNPYEEYERMRQWILDTPKWDHEVGWIFEKIWHIIFKQEIIL